MGLKINQMKLLICFLGGAVTAALLFTCIWLSQQPAVTPNLHDTLQLSWMHKIGSGDSSFSESTDGQLGMGHAADSAVFAFKVHAPVGDTMFINIQRDSAGISPLHSKHQVDTSGMIFP